MLFVETPAIQTTTANWRDWWVMEWVLTVSWEFLFASHAAFQVLLAAGKFLQIPSAPVLSSSPADVKHVKTSVS